MASRGASWRVAGRAVADFLSDICGAAMLLVCTALTLAVVAGCAVCFALVY